MKNILGKKKDKHKCNFFDIGYGQLDFGKYSQAAQACTDLCILEYDLGKVCGKIIWMTSSNILNLWVEKYFGFKKKNNLLKNHF